MEEGFRFKCRNASIRYERTEEYITFPDDDIFASIPSDVHINGNNDGLSDDFQL